MRAGSCVRQKRAGRERQFEEEEREGVARVRFVRFCGAGFDLWLGSDITSVGSWFSMSKRASESEEGELRLPTGEEVEAAAEEGIAQQEQAAEAAGPSSGAASAGAEAASEGGKSRYNKTLQAVLQQKLVESGEKDRLTQLLRERLVEVGWKDELKAHCREVMKDRAAKGANNLNIDSLTREVIVHAQKKVPDSVKAEFLAKVREFVLARKD